MKHPAHVIIVALLALAGHLCAAPGPWQIRVEMQVVSVPTSAALQLVPALRDARQVESVVNDLQSRIARGEATLIAWPVVWTGSGERGESATIEEFRYPTDFDPLQVPHGLFNPPALPDGTPTAFETRNLGMTLEVRPTASRDGTWIDVALAPHRVAFLGFRRFKGGQMKWGGPAFIDQPEFFTTKTTARMLVRSGQWALTGTFVVSKPEPHVELFILRATAHSLNP